MELRGIFAPITTPLSADGDSLALEHLKTNFAAFNKTKIAGYVVGGSTGEAILLSTEETDRVFAAVPELAGPGKILVAGTGTESRVETISRTRRAAALGYKVALVRTPHYYKPLMTHTALLEFFRGVADASPIPVLVYSIPQFTGIEVPAELVARLAEHRNICGIKESWGKLPVVKEILAAAPKGFQTLVGSAAILEPSLKFGAVGAILALANIVPDLCVELYEAALAGNSARAEEIQAQIAPVAQKCVSELGIAGVKFSMDRMGMYGGSVRSPLLPLSDEKKSEIIAALSTLQIPAAR